MPSCVVKYCKNNSKRNKKDTGITYHRFPGLKIIADRWTTVIRLSRQDSSWTPGKQSVICSAHFNDSDFTVSKAGLKRLTLGAVPQNLLFLSSAQPSNNISKDDLVKAEQSTSPAAEGNNNASDNEKYILSDLPDSGSTVNWSNNFWLRRELHKKAAIQLKHAKIIKALRGKNRRLKEANGRLKNIINSLKLRPGRQTVAVTAEEAPSSDAHLATTLLGDDSTTPASDVFRMPLYSIIPDSKTKIKDKNFKIIRSTLNTCESYKYTF